MARMLAIPVGLGLTAAELNELIVAVHDREEVATPEQRAALARGRGALNRELAELLNREHTPA